MDKQRVGIYIALAPNECAAGFHMGRRLPALDITILDGNHRTIPERYLCSGNGLIVPQDTVDNQRRGIPGTYSATAVAAIGQVPANRAVSDPGRGTAVAGDPASTVSRVPNDDTIRDAG